MGRGASAGNCPKDDVIAAFAAGTLPDDLLETVAQHFGQCDRCAHRLRQAYAADDTLRAVLSPPAGTELPSPTPQLQEMLRRTKAIGQQPPQDRGSSSVNDCGAGLDQPPAEIGRYRIREQLGRGTFGTVYLAFDPELRRDVAIKVPRVRYFSDGQTIDRFLEEARAAALLRHDGIVGVLDFGRSDEVVCFVVMEYVPGESLAKYLSKSKLPIARSVQWVAAIAEALDYMHRHGLIHRDLKPANILLDENNRPRVADFGLAIREEHRAYHDSEVAGTLKYMSPEQLRGDVGCIDARTDVWALGVVLYRLLVGRCPFDAAQVGELRMQIQEVEPPSLREADRTVPQKLEEICLRCLAKSAGARYSSALEVASDLNSWLEDQFSPDSLALTNLRTRGLRSFEPEDAPFFTHLLPGLRDQEGVPETVRYWERCFTNVAGRLCSPIHALLGPSGSGKSSFVKAALAPRFPVTTKCIYVEADSDTTEQRLNHAVQTAYPQLPTSQLLDEILASLRTDILRKSQRKAILVVDQFEQWLQTRSPDPQFVDALRQCDGVHLQCLVVVRDDFLTSLTHVLGEAKVVLSAGKTYALMERYNHQDAVRVLTALGRAHGSLPQAPLELSTDQSRFVETAVHQLVDEGPIVPVRLALLAEVMRGHPWTTSSLRQIGGVAGVGVAFLEATFASQSARPEVKLHQHAARCVLEALLPPPGQSTKGVSRSLDHLVKAAGYEHRPREFQHLMHVLDADLRLITAVEAAEENSEPLDAVLPQQKYRLTHDYLVSAVRRWLTATQRATPRGRAHIRLTELSDLWAPSRKAGRLPTLFEWLRIRMLTTPQRWTPVQSRMMAAAGRKLATRALMAAAVFVAVLAVAYKTAEDMRSHDLANRLLSATTAEVPNILQEAEQHWSRLKPRLEEYLKHQLPKDAEGEYPEQAARRRLHVGMALVQSDSAHLDFILERLMLIPPADIPTVASTLAPHRDVVIDKLWAQLEAIQDDRNDKTLRLASTLVVLDPRNERWQSVLPRVATALLSSRPLQLSIWTEHLAKLAAPLRAYLMEAFHDATTLTEAEKRNLAEVFANYAQDTPRQFSKAIALADRSQLAIMLSRTAMTRKDLLADELSTLFAELSKPETGNAHNWPPVTRGLRATIESHDGLVGDGGAIVQELTLSQSSHVVAQMALYGYRAVTFRPFAAHGKLSVAIAWRRDGRDSIVESDLSAEDLRALAARRQAQGMAIVDITHYVDQKGHPRFAATWIRTALAGTMLRWYVDESLEEHLLLSATLREKNFRTMRFVERTDALGHPRFSVIWQQADAATNAGSSLSVAPTGDFGDVYPGYCQSDCQFHFLDLFKRDNYVAHDLLIRGSEKFNVAVALMQLGKPRQALPLLNELLAHKPKNAQLRELRVQAYAAAGNVEKAREEISWYVGAGGTAEKVELMRLRLAICENRWKDVVHRLEVIEQHLAKGPDNPKLSMLTVRANSLAAGFLKTFDLEEAARCRERAISLLNKTDKYKHGKTLLRDQDFDALRGDSRFQRLLVVQGLDARYAGAWRDSTDTTSELLFGLPPTAHRQACRIRLDRGLTPHCVSVRFSKASEQTLASSVWHQQSKPVHVQITLAQQLANCAIALTHLKDTGPLDTVMQGGHGRDMRTYAIAHLAASDAAAGYIVERFRSTTSPQERYHLLLALGTCDADNFDQTLIDSLVSNIETLACRAPHAEVRAAAISCLLRWGMVVPSVPPSPQTVKGNWSVNSVNQTMISLDPPVSTKIGSPITEPHHEANEVLQDRPLNGPYALGATETTIGQFSEFLSDPAVNRYYSTLGGFRFKRPFAPSLDCPQISVRFFDAIRFCQWLSEREGVPRDQWCYPDIWTTPDGEYRVPENYLSRTGYRLPTEAEWEFACRAGGRSARHYGNSDDGLYNVAWGAHNSGGLAHPVAHQLPNEFGFFDMLGNVREWCGDPYRSWKDHLHEDSEYVFSKETPRVLRGGTYSSVARDLRSARRLSYGPNLKHVSVGFRIARTEANR